MQLENDGKVKKIKNSGYTSLSPDSEPMFEFHMDESKELSVHLKNLQFKGLLSV
jgi:hypothetical protein